MPIIACLDRVRIEKVRPDAVRPDAVRPDAVRLDAVRLATATAILALGTQGGFAAQVFATDLIVQGSACIGLDCATSESFGSDTLRLKENNLRIHFNDTSSSSSFPSNDWRIVINDSSNGGANYYAIEDATAGNRPLTIQAGAGANALVLKSGGNIGVGTSNPVVQLHVADGNSPSLRLEQDGSSGFTPQVWDLAGNEANFFIRDVTNASKLPFRIKPGAPNDAIFVAASGNIGLGTDAPSAALDVVRSADEAVAMHLSRTGGGAPTTWIVGNQASGNLVFEVEGGNTPFKSTKTARNNLLRLGFPDDNSVDITGTLEVNDITVTGDITANGITTNGSCSVGCDRVFAPDYPLLSIDEQVRQMWANSYLPNIGPTPEEGRYDLTDKVLRMLSELEKAHIYIGQLHGQIGSLDGEISALRSELDQLWDNQDG